MLVKHLALAHLGSCLCVVALLLAMPPRAIAQTAAMADAGNANCPIELELGYTQSSATVTASVVPRDCGIKESARRSRGYQIDSESVASMSLRVTSNEGVSHLRAPCFKSRSECHWSIDEEHPVLDLATYSVVAKLLDQHERVVGKVTAEWTCTSSPVEQQCSKGK